MPELTCRELVELVTDYLEGALPQVERTRFEEHLADCEGCTNYLDQMRHSITLLGSTPPDPLPPDVERAFVDAFRTWRAADESAT